MKEDEWGVVKKAVNPFQPGEILKVLMFPSAIVIFNIKIRSEIFVVTILHRPFVVRGYPVILATQHQNDACIGIFFSKRLQMGIKQRVVKLERYQVLICRIIRNDFVCLAVLVFTDVPYAGKFREYRFLQQGACSAHHACMKEYLWSLFFFDAK